MRAWMKSFIAVATVSASVAASGAARAQSTPYAPMPAAQGGEGQACYPNETCNAGLTCASHFCVKLPPASAQAPNGEYVAPIQQQTQQIYVPQSVAMSGSREIKDWSEGEPIPPGYHPRTRVRTGLIVAGLVTFGTVYLAFNVLPAAASLDVCKAIGGTVKTNCNDASMLFIPVVGPFIQATRTGDSAALTTLLVIDGVAQAAGVAMFIAGLAWQKTTLVRNDLGSNTAPAKPTIMPYWAGTSGGLVGAF